MASKVVEQNEDRGEDSLVFNWLEMNIKTYYHAWYEYHFFDVERVNFCCDDDEKAMLISLIPEVKKKK